MLVYICTLHNLPKYSDLKTAFHIVITNSYLGSIISFKKYIKMGLKLNLIVHKVAGGGRTDAVQNLSCQRNLKSFFHM